MKTQAPFDTVFARDVLAGLQSKPKTLSSKYFYDQNGDRLFREIMKMPEYYLTRCEWEILQDHRDDLFQQWKEHPFDLIELGAGDGTKTKILLHHFLKKGGDFRYLPIDISENALVSLVSNLSEELPGLEVEGKQGDYFNVLDELSQATGRKKVVLFLGSNIGNFSPPQCRKFLTLLHDALNPGDQVLIGFDLKKAPEIILAAYNDPTGITAAFNLNLLSRINRELKADFGLDAFQHWETYDPISGAARSYLVSKKAQEVRIGTLEETISFTAWEAIHVELSQKFSLPDIEDLARSTGFRLIENYLDQKKYFVDSLWEKD